MSAKAESVPMPLVDAALAYRAAGLSVLAARNKEFVGQEWKSLSKTPASEEEIARMFMRPGVEQLAIICGAVSGNLECLDFDNGGSAWQTWSAMVEEEAPDFLDRLPMEQSPSGGRHVLYRVQDVTIPGARKLAAWPPGGMGQKIECLIETRGEGAYFVCAPSPGYAMLQGDLTAIPEITPEERTIMIRLATALDEMPAVGSHIHRPSESCGASKDTGRPGEDFNRRGDVLALLQRHGWRHIRTAGPNLHLCRPGKERGTSATLRYMDGVPVFYPFTSSTVFDCNKAYSPFQVLAILEHGGDFTSAATELRKLGYGVTVLAEPNPSVEGNAEVDLEGIFAQPSEKERQRTPRFPNSLLRVPGFMGKVIDYTLSTAFRPQPILALGGAIALQATLAGRQIMDESGTRTNLYILALAESGGGKERPREVNDEILSCAGLEHYIAPEEIASDTGIISALATCPVQLFQGDEIGDTLKQVANTKSDHLKAIPSLLMKLYSKSNGIYRGKAYADPDKRKVIENPCLTIFGTSTPGKVFDGLTIETLQDGFFGRLVMFESHERPTLVEDVRRLSPPCDIVDIATWWGTQYRSLGNLNDVKTPSSKTLSPRIVPKTVQAKEMFKEYVRSIEDEIKKGDATESAIWARCIEKTAKFILVHSCSKDHMVPLIDVDSVEWGCKLADYLTRKMIFDASRWVSASLFDKEQKAMFRFIEDNGGRVEVWKFNKKFRSIPARTRDELVHNMVATYQIKQCIRKTGGPSVKEYVLHGQSTESANEDSLPE